MGGYIARRVLLTVPVVLGVTLAVFLMLHFLPGDPVMMMLTEPASGVAPMTAEISAEMYQNMRREMGLDQPLSVQYGQFLLNAGRGNLGKSFRSGEPVLDLILRNLPHTIVLTFASLGIAVLVGFFLGMVAAVKFGTWIDRLTMSISVVGVSMPSFWLGIMLLLVFALHLRLLPAVGVSADWRSLVLPAVALGFSASAIIARLVRTSLIEVMQLDFVRTARAKGAHEWVVIFKHVLANALIPVVTVVGLQFGSLLGGTVVVETVFARPGIGSIAVGGIFNKDFPVVQGVVLFSALIYVVVNLLVDISYAWFDPRIRYETR